MIHSTEIDAEVWHVCHKDMAPQFPAVSVFVTGRNSVVQLLSDRAIAPSDIFTTHEYEVVIRSVTSVCLSCSGSDF